MNERMLSQVLKGEMNEVKHNKESHGRVIKY